TGKSNSVVAKLKARRADRYLDPAVEEQFAAGRLLACISSRPGQSGRADGYILEGEELAFYMRKLEKKGKNTSAVCTSQYRRGWVVHLGSLETREESLTKDKADGVVGLTFLTGG
ncbi:40S ribosomal protein, partial [Perkinsus olseni]